MGLLDWLLGGHTKEAHATMGAGMHQMQAAPTSTSGMHTHHSASMSMGTTMVKDPVCGMDVDPERAAATAVHEGTTYYFCSAGCKRSFEENPTKYLAGSGQMKEDMHDTHDMHGHHHGGGCCG
ncbi:MAG: YHS domain-containing protein [Chloroflexota bacterium]